MPTARLALILCLLTPLALLTWDAYHDALGPDPVKYAIHTTGFMAVLCLLLSLTITPLRQLTSFNWLVQFRRSLGVFAFYYAYTHLFIYYQWDRQGDLDSTAYEIFHRYYLTIGFSSLALMLPLWATSFNAAIRTLGGRRWKLLHLLTYPAAILACTHFYLQSKADKRLPILFLAALTLLLLWRIVSFILHRLRMPPAAKSAAAAMTLPGAKSPSWKGQLKVIALFPETPSVRTLRLALPDGNPIPFTFRAGQFLRLTLPITGPDGRPLSRSYTIASPPTRDAYLELTVKREDRGLCSAYLHDKLMTGGTLTISAPLGRFTFDPASSNDTAVLLIAGGVGITPVMSILRDLTDRSWPGQIDLVFSVRTPADIIFADELRFLERRHPNLHTHFTFTRESPPNWPGPQGRLTASLLQQLVPDAPTRPAYICGPDAMASSLRSELLSLGLPPNRIHLESFTPTASSPPQGGVGDLDPNAPPATVTFARSNLSAPIPPNRTVLDIAESLHIPLDYECRSGICGTCRCRLLSGQVTMPTRTALSDADEADGYILACQARATQDLTIDA